MNQKKLRLPPPAEELSAVRRILQRRTQPEMLATLLFLLVEATRKIGLDDEEAVDVVVATYGQISDQKESAA